MLNTSLLLLFFSLCKSKLTRYDCLLRSDYLMKPFSGEHKICKHVVELHWRQTGKIKLLVSMKIERCKALFLYIIESLRCYYSAVWEKVVKKRCFFSPMNFTSSSHLPFPTVRHLPFGIARQRSVEFKIKGWENCCRGLLA